MNKLLDISQMVVNFRKELHQMPEIGFSEINTSRYIIEKLQEAGFKTEVVANTGVIGFRKGSMDSKAIAIRADIDGLRIKEETGLSFSSKNEGMMHACGHDGHTAILLGLAFYISGLEKIQRDIVLIFQPAEEGPGGAEVIVREGVLEKYNIEAIVGLHIMPELEEGKIGLNSGPIMAQTGEIDICINAKGGHGAMPHKGIDGICIAAQLINAYQSIISRNIEPIEGAVLSIGKINGGEARNAIAGKVEMEGTIRAYRQEIYDIIKEKMKEINKGMEIMHGIDINMQVRDMYPAVVNDNKLFEIVKEALDDNEVEIIKPMMIAEDFSYYQRQIPGIFFMLGSRNEKEGFVFPLHHCRFNYGEDVLVHGVKTYVKICKKIGVF
ncbi:M20 metallopeptidase family protein [Brassicibacter mesophilus]|uniref:M20 metallopeptidase family protein n=1 Tax=Brassicibacter mesophilus TaxID=745119 RepID=UPI003D235990